ncbi:hypothetical protein HELRODRAFT_77652, partial [Helobdella robusta]|uniref:Ribosome production factor 2 homolog n=1 Tax=Helobdella robusta TaxID=6412 RepID=T1G316_HELRO
KAKNQRSKRYLEKCEPQIHENDKKALFIKGGRTSETVTRILKELASLKKPNSTMFQKKNMTRPFDDPTSIEFFSRKCDSSLFMFGSDSKKRPNNLIIGRMYDFQILDMFEFGVANFKSLQEFKEAKVAIGTKPCLIFSGEQFEKVEEFSRLKSLLIDFFQGPQVSQIRLSGIEHVFHFVLTDECLTIRSYKILLKKSGTKVPRIELDEIGPSLDLKLRRRKIAGSDMYELARKQPKAAKIKKQKNVKQNPFGSKVGQIHMKHQDYDELQTRKMKGLKRKKLKNQTEQNSKKMKLTEDVDVNNSNDNDDLE